MPAKRNTPLISPVCGKENTDIKKVYMIEKLPFIKNTGSGNFFLLAGPCVVENKDLCFEVAERVKRITDKLEIPYVFKASYRKANRSRSDSFTGIGDMEGLEVLKQVRETFQVPVVTDIHSEAEAEKAGHFADVLQIPAFLCRQTDLLVAAAKTGKFVNIKKGQFLAADSMKFAAEKVVKAGNGNVMLTERGTMFGYQDLIVDYRGIVEMKKFGYPVIMDITHSLQQPNQSSGVSGGRPDLIETIARASIAVGVDGIFIETHPDPSRALSDGANMLKLDLLEDLLVKLIKIRKAVNSI
jgi:2-dehydro-3-deoxyphosphooctonate aldolase (KDO 8-P synthase)